jgi:hypothetical protein
MNSQERAKYINNKYDVLISLPWKAVQYSDSYPNCWVIVDKDGKMIADCMIGPVAEYIVNIANKIEKRRKMLFKLDFQLNPKERK